MIKTVNNKLQHTLKGLTILSGLVFTIGLCGSYETDRINGMQLLTQLIIMACITFTAYVVLSYINTLITNRLFDTYGSNKKYDRNKVMANNKNISEIAWHYILDGIWLRQIKKTIKSEYIKTIGGSGYENQKHEYSRE